MRPEEHQAYSFEDERKRIKACFCAFVEGSLVSHDIDAVLQLFCDDVIGIGMGAQGIVRCREDLRPILMNTRSDVDDSQTAIDYSNMQVRYYGDDYASINAMVSVTTTVRGHHDRPRRTSHEPHRPVRQPAPDRRPVAHQYGAGDAAFHRYPGY